MSIILEKSETNFQASKLLHDDQLYSSSIHCSYYRCYQKIMHIISESSEGENSHGNTINKLRTDIINKKKDHSFIDEHLFQLKKLRNKADYNKILRINESDSKKAIKAADIVSQKLNEIYEI